MKKINNFFLKKGVRLNSNNRGEIALNYMFIIFVSIIAVFVIVGMLVKWSMSSTNVMCKLTGDCDTGGQVDKDSIEVNDQNTFRNEIIKHAKLCYDRARSGQISGDLCYTVKCNGCSTTCDAAMVDKIEKSIGGGGLDCTAFGTSEKAIIEYDFKESKVVIK